MAESEEELKSLLMRVKEESERDGLKLILKNLRSLHPVPSLHGKQKGEKWKELQTLFSWDPKSLWMVTAAMKLRQLLLVRKAMRDHLDSLVKIRAITLLTKVHIVRAIVFPVVVYGCENWAIKATEH